MKLSYVLLLTIFATFSTSVIASEPSATDPCLADSSTNATIRACLNEYAESTLAVGTPADKLFKQRLKRIYGKYEIKTKYTKATELAQAFNIFVEKNSQMNGGDTTKTCYDFDRMTPASRLRKVKLLRQQIDQGALFLAELHARALGRQVSLLFPIKELSICTPKLMDGRDTAFQQRTHFIGMSEKVQSANDLLVRWATGEPIRREDSWKFFNGLRKYKQAAIDKDVGAVLRDKLADNWTVLNPTGPGRTTALYTLAEGITLIREFKQDREDLNEEEKYHRLNQTLNSGPGFGEKDQALLDKWAETPGLIDQLYNLWRLRMGDPGQMIRVLESAIIRSAKESGKLHLVLRKLNAVGSFANDKNITVRVEAMISGSLPIQRFRELPPESEQDQKKVEFSRTTVNPFALLLGMGGIETESVVAEGYQDVHLNGDEQTNLIAVNLIDDITVSFEIPDISVPTYKRVTLWETFQQISLSKQNRPL